MRRMAIAGVLTSAALVAAAGAAQRPANAPSASVADAVAGDARLSLFAGALRQSEVGATVEREEAWTLFAPADRALRNEGSAFLLETVLVVPENGERLDDVLGHHLVRGTRLDLDADPESEVVTSASGTALAFERVGSGLRIDGHAVVIDRIDAGKGVVYVIDRMLWPEYWSADTLVER